MARNSLPESLELLLDTMCNTFGGVMFITISMVITLMICQQQLTPEKQLEEEKKRLEACRKENLALNERRAREERRLAELEKLARKDEGEKDPGLAAAVAGLEQEIRKTKRECETLESELKIADEQLKRLDRDNRRRELENLEKRRELEKQKALLEDENQLLVQKLAVLRGQLAGIPVKHLHFSRSRKTTRSPYFIIVKGGKLYPAGNTFVGWRRDHITVHRENNIFQLIPLHGIPLATVNAKTLLASLPGFSRESHFLGVFVGDDSLASFVAFRRLLRSCGCMVDWEVYTRHCLVFLVTNPDYSAAN